MSTDHVKLDKMVNEGRVIVTPCKNLPGNRSTSYDDRFIIEIAAAFDAAVISNDNFSDLLNEDPSKYSNFSSVTNRSEKPFQFPFFCCNFSFQNGIM